MTLKINNTPEMMTVVLAGHLDTKAAGEIEPQIQELEAQATKPLTLDCTSLEYISSSGLRLFLRLRKAFAANGQGVTLQGVNMNVMEVLKITGFDKLFQLI